ncbi:hypothetical protein ALT721_2180034 [Alteromonas alvinellae]
MRICPGLFAPFIFPFFGERRFFAEDGARVGRETRFIVADNGIMRSYIRRQV